MSNLEGVLDGCMRVGRQSGQCFPMGGSVELFILTEPEVDLIVGEIEQLAQNIRWTVVCSLANVFLVKNRDRCSRLQCKVVSHERVCKVCCMGLRVFRHKTIFYNY